MNIKKPSLATILTTVFMAATAFGLSIQAASAESPFTNPGPEAGQIVGSPAVPARDLYPVTVVTIDGDNVLPRETIWLQPGKYTLTVSATIINPKGLPNSGRSNRFQEDGLNEIEVVVEAGKTYYLAAHYDGKDRRAPYSTVVYRVEDTQ